MMSSIPPPVPDPPAPIEDTADSSAQCSKEDRGPPSVQEETMSPRVSKAQIVGDTVDYLRQMGAAPVGGYPAPPPGAEDVTGMSMNGKKMHSNRGREEDFEGNTFYKFFTACAGSFSHVSKVKQYVAKAVENNELRDAISCRGRVMSDLSIIDTEEEEKLQMQRLGSWGTVGTMTTAETVTSDGTGFAPTSVVRHYDDDGNCIDPKLLQKFERDKRTKRKRIVKFEYPPISSLKQYPKANPEDLPQLFYTEEELDQIEEDRASTFAADDVEIVAVSTSNSDHESQGKSPTIPTSPADVTSAQPFGSYVATPSNPNMRKANFSFAEQERGRDRDVAEKKPRRRAHTLATTRSRKRPENHSVADGTSATGGEKRLIKSVHIFLRERSVGV